MALGLDRTMVSSMAIPARLARTGRRRQLRQGPVGAEPSRTAASYAWSCREKVLRPLHHSHVGGAFETEDEIRRSCLTPSVRTSSGWDQIPGTCAGLGIDPAALINRYADRIGGIHIKDCFGDYLDPSATEPA